MKTRKGARRQVVHILAVSDMRGFMGYAGGLKSEVKLSCSVCADRRKEEAGFIKWLQMKFSPIHQCPTISHLHLFQTTEF
jgi:hypothetical protein